MSRWTLGAVAVTLAASFSATGCGAEVKEPFEPDLVVDVSSELDPQGKPSAAAPTMTCTQETGGCVPAGYRLVKCALAGFKLNSYVAPCVTAKCPAVYGPSNANGESCFAPQKIQGDGTWQVYFALAPDASYDFRTYSVVKGAQTTTVLARTSANVLSSVGEATDCGGTPRACSVFGP